MCVIIAGETQPDTTKLINIPVKLNGDDNSYNFFMYRGNSYLNFTLANYFNLRYS